MDIAELRARLRAPYDPPAPLRTVQVVTDPPSFGAPVSSPEAVDLVEQPLTPAAVLVPFLFGREPGILLTKRTAHLNRHAGQVSFPGGRLDPGEDAPTAALREAYEEIALDPAHVRVEGWIHPVFTLVSASLIMPLVASVPGRPHVVASPAEVERVFDVPLRDLADPEIFHEERWSFPGRVIPGRPDSSFPVWFFEVEGELIWGATARMIHELLRVVLLPAG